MYIILQLFRLHVNNWVRFRDARTLDDRRSDYILVFNIANHTVASIFIALDYRFKRLACPHTVAVINAQYVPSVYKNEL